MVQPDMKIVMVFTLIKKAYGKPMVYPANGAIKSKVMKGLVVDLADVF